MLKYVIPKIRLDDLRPMIGCALLGGLIGGLYGIGHDLMTYAISPEYFTRLKFQQFDYADFGFGNRVFVATIGFLATWWVGLIASWFLARRLIPNQSGGFAFSQIRKGIACVFLFGLTFGMFGYAYGLWRGPNADYSSWLATTEQLRVSDVWSFVRVAYIHNAGYVGGLTGLIFALVTIRPSGDHAPHMSPGS